MTTSLTFSLPAPYPTLNKTLRMHWAALNKMKRAMRGTIIASLGGPDKLPKEPFKHAHIRIERWSTGAPDDDNIHGGGAKQMIDCLTTPKLCANRYVRNKYGLGIIVDDSPAHITTEYHAVKCRRDEQKTLVTITDLGGAP